MEGAGKSLSKGDFLVSQPFMYDGNFRRTVVFMTEYNSEGALGFILNRPLNYKVEDLLMEFPSFDQYAHFGGPVSTNTIHYIHRVGDLLEGSVEICKGIYWGGDFDKLKVLVSSELITSKDIRFYVGYSGWSPGQLEDELTLGSWIVAPSDPNVIFSFNKGDMWKKVLEHKGENYDIIAQIPENFYLN
ncbi:MAG: YqgE/AlgH family protein [Saprospiraceae bacterium]